jgi:hypothetical protein
MHGEIGLLNRKDGPNNNNNNKWRPARSSAVTILMHQLKNYVCCMTLKSQTANKNQQLNWTSYIVLIVSRCHCKFNFILQFWKDFLYYIKKTFIPSSSSQLTRYQLARLLEETVFSGIPKQNASVSVASVLKCMSRWHAVNWALKNVVDEHPSYVSRINEGQNWWDTCLGALAQ